MGSSDDAFLSAAKPAVVVIPNPDTPGDDGDVDDDAKLGKVARGAGCSGRACWSHIARCKPLNYLLTALLVTAVFIALWIVGHGHDSPLLPWKPPAPLSPSHPWYNATQRAKATLTKMSLQDKVDAVTGVGWQKGPCVGNIRGIKGTDFNGLCLQDGPAGVRYNTNATAFPASVNVASTWDKGLMLQHGSLMGAEFRHYGINVFLGPMMNMYRAPAAGRNWEGQGADPYLAATSASLQVRGIQSQGVIATAKHLIANEQEHFRDFVDSKLDMRTMMELYFAPFEACVREGVGAIMCSYNKLNGYYACEQSDLINYVLKGPDVNFRGLVMTDWWAAHDTIGTAFSTDMMMPGSKNVLTKDSYFGQALVTSVQKGYVPKARLDDMVTRVLAAYYMMGQDKNFPKTTQDSWSKRPPRPIDGEVPNEASRDHVRAVGIASSVLLKNDGILPLNASTLMSLAVLGEDAGPPPNMNDAADRGSDDGTLVVGWGSGTTELPYLITPLQGIEDWLKKNGHPSVSVVSNLNNLDTQGCANLAHSSDVAVVFVNADSGEGYLTVELNAGDRNDLKLWHYGDDLINAVAAANKRTIVVIHAVGPVEMPWLSNPNVAAVIMAGLPGQETGNAIASVLFGESNPSGRLPYTIHASRSDYPADVLYTAGLFSSPAIEYLEGLFIDYFHAEKNGIKPLFAFGHGLSYTNFTYNDTVRLNVTSLKADDVLSSAGVVGCSVTVANTGAVGGHEVVQLYVSFPEEAAEPPKLLKGFERVFVPKGQSVDASFALGLRELRVWGVKGSVGPAGALTWDGRNATDGSERWGVVKGTYHIKDLLLCGDSEIKIEKSYTLEFIMSSADEIRAKFTQAGQGHVFQFWDSLDQAQRDELLSNLRAIDVARVNNIFKVATSAPPSAANVSSLSPLPKSSFDSVISADPSKVAGWRSKGLEMIAAGKVGVILLAGGQGTRLGSSAPKGCYDIGLPSHKSLFQLQAERIQRLQVVAAKEHAGKVGPKGVVIPWYVMTSGPTRKPTEQFFKENNYFGMKAENVVFFEQGVLPAFTNDGKIFLETKSSLANAPDGNGGIYAALRKEGVLDDLEKRGIPMVHAYCVDNCLVKVADPVFIGYCVEKNADCGAKAVPKASPHEPVGVICLRNGKFGVVEYSEIDKSIAEQTDPSTGELAYKAANIANHFYTTAFLKRAADFEPKLEYHIAKKKIKHVDLASGQQVSPDKANGIKLELFIFDVFPFTERMAVLEAPRNEDFSPLKNAPGSKDGDSPETSRAAILAQTVRFARKAGATVTGEELEISPLVTYDGEGLEGLKGKTIKTPKYIASVDELKAL
ncbi:hypothetical protein HK101_009864 [Irineochytrium annulatum]|nr:hypothetical protein HK101_009864 [Irineochytrium annulatum]